MENYRSQSLVASSIKQDAGLSAPADADSPHIVIRGESTPYTPTFCHSLLANKISFIDYLSFTYRPVSEEEPLSELQMELLNLFAVYPESWEFTKSGWYGYENKANLEGHGLVAWGGSSQRGTYHVEITGTGCAKVFDWLDVYHWGITNQVKITRVDIAHDDLEGHLVNIPNALKWHKDGLFNNGGRSPKIQSIDDHGSGDGYTLNVGKRKNGRVIRIYEKGRQLGDPDNPWCRAELETRSKDRKIPWDTVINPDRYLAGSCEAFSYLSTEQSRIKTLSKAKEITLDTMVKYCKVGYGQLINLLRLSGYSSEQIVDMLQREGIPKKLETYYQK